MAATIFASGIPLVIDEKFVRASGPGGQNVNKVATAVELRFDVRNSPLPPDAQARLLSMAAGRLAGDGVMLIDSREYRTQTQNREAARARLIALVERALVRPKTRRATRPKAGARERRLTSKHIRSGIKHARSRKPSAED